MTDIDPSIERMAREIIKGFNGDPDMPVQAGTPQVYGTPAGDVFAVAPGADTPLWRLYIPAAGAMLALARQIDAELNTTAVIVEAGDTPKEQAA